MRSGRDHGLVFGRTETQPFAPTSVYQRARVAWKDTTVQPLTLHQLRHVAASLMIAAGINTKALSKYLGHANISITFDIYGHLMPDDISDAASRIDAYLMRADTSARIAQITRNVTHCPIPCPAPPAHHPETRVVAPSAAPTAHVEATFA